MDRTPRGEQRGISLLWVILLLAALAIFGAKAWNDSKKRQRDEMAALEQKRQSESAIAKERAEFDARLAAERSKSEYDKAASALVAARKRWADAVEVAAASSRVAMNGPVTHLQTVRRETEALILPKCLDQPRQQLVDAMQLQIDGFLAFMRNDLKLGEVFAVAKFEEAKALHQQSKEAAERCGAATGSSS